MSERNYLVIEVYETGAQRIIAQCSSIDDALLFLGELVSRYDHPRNLFAIRTINVTNFESVSRYQNESSWLPKEEKENE